MAPRLAARVRAALRALKRHHGDGAAVAVAIGVSATAVNACLRGGGPSGDLAQKAAKGLGVSLAWIFTRRVPEIEWTRKDGGRWVYAVDRLTDAERNETTEVVVT